MFAARCVAGGREEARPSQEPDTSEGVLKGWFVPCPHTRARPGPITARGQRSTAVCRDESTSCRAGTQRASSITIAAHDKYLFYASLHKKRLKIPLGIQRGIISQPSNPADSYSPSHNCAHIP